MLVSLQVFTPSQAYNQDTARRINFDFYGDSIELIVDPSIIVAYSGLPSAKAIDTFYAHISAGNFQPLVNALLEYKRRYNLDDWLYYQLIRKTAQSVSPKAANYERYTLYKWFLLTKSGYDARLSVGPTELLFYVLTNENIYNIPFYMQDSRQYVCLNYHDYGNNIDFTRDSMREIQINVPGARNAFSYKITQLPRFETAEYHERELQFNYHEKTYHFKVMLNPQLQTIFLNYPGVDFGEYFNIPLSSETYNTLIPLLKKDTKGMSEEQGVDFLMRFTRFAFLYENDQDNFGKEKRMTPEETLLYSHSDCDDRAGLFFYLVKEIYNLPAIAILYPTHVTIAIKFNKQVGEPVVYNGSNYYICDPTAQAENLDIGQMAPAYHDVPYKVVYAYEPVKK